MRKTAAFALILLCGSAAAAQEDWATYGNNLTCGNYINNRRTPNPGYDTVVYGWFLGFVTSYNYYGSTPQVKTALPRDTILAWFDKYCRDNPLNAISAGSVELIKVYAK